MQTLLCLLECVAKQATQLIYFSAEHAYSSDSNRLHSPPQSSTLYSSLSTLDSLFAASVASRRVVSPLQSKNALSEKFQTYFSCLRNFERNTKAKFERGYATVNIISNTFK